MYSIVHAKVSKLQNSLINSKIRKMIIRLWVSPKWKILIKVKLAKTMNLHVKAKAYKVKKQRASWLTLLQEKDQDTYDCVAVLWAISPSSTFNHGTIKRTGI